MNCHCRLELLKKFFENRLIHRSKHNKHCESLPAVYSTCFSWARISYIKDSCGILKPLERQLRRMNSYKYLYDRRIVLTNRCCISHTIHKQLVSCTYIHIPIAMLFWSFALNILQCVGSFHYDIRWWVPTLYFSNYELSKFINFRWIISCHCNDNNNNNQIMLMFLFVNFEYWAFLLILFITICARAYPERLGPSPQNIFHVFSLV